MSEKVTLGVKTLITSKEKVIASLNERKNILKNAYEKIRNKFESDGGENLPFQTKTVFNHPLFLIKHELKFIDSLIKELTNGYKRKINN